jgi:tetratricopeptide (TPR) repeat protein
MKKGWQMSQAEIDQLLETALSHHDAGRLAQAEALYEQILAKFPDHDEALHLLGVLALQVHRPDLAIDYLRRATVLQPNIPAYHGNLGNAFRGHGQLDEAVASYRRTLELEPNLAEAHNNLGAALFSQGKRDEAIDSYRRALELKPDFPEAQNNLGMALADAGKLDEAAACYRRSLQLKPDYAEALNNLGIALAGQGRLDEAAACYHRSLQLKPDYAEALNNLGIALADQKKLDEAVACYRRSLQLKPSQAEAHNNLGNALNDLGKLDESIASCRRALELKPDFAEAHNNLGNAWRDLGKLDEAVASFRRAVEQKPDFAMAHNNLAVALRDQGALDEAQTHLDEAIRLAPLFDEAHANRAMLWVLRGDFVRGFRELEWRWKTKMFAGGRSQSQPLWDGAPLDGRTILLHCEQGFGDSFQFIRYALSAAQAGGNVIVACQPEIKRLLRSSLGKVQLFGYGEPLPSFDVQCPLLSMPMACGTTLETMPRQVPYVTADPELIARWQQKVAGATKAASSSQERNVEQASTLAMTASLEARSTSLKVGLVWSGNKSQKYDRNRSLTLKTLAPLGRVPGVCFFSLQKGEPSLEAREPPEGMTLIDWSDELVDFADTAALIANLDLVITTDTSVAHLAGAMAAPVWTMLWFGGDWRYLLEPDRNRWYPTMRLFRQPAPGDWRSVTLRVAGALADVSTAKAKER